MNFALRPSRDAATTRYTTALSKSFNKGSNIDTYLEISPFQHMISCEIYIYLKTMKKINLTTIFIYRIGFAMLRLSIFRINPSIFDIQRSLSILDYRYRPYWFQIGQRYNLLRKLSYRFIGFKY